MSDSPLWDQIKRQREEPKTFDEHRVRFMENMERHKRFWAQVAELRSRNPEAFDRMMREELKARPIVYPKGHVAPEYPKGWFE
jgi:hypothetical protein